MIWLLYFWKLFTSLSHIRCFFDLQLSKPVLNSYLISNLVEMWFLGIYFIQHIKFVYFYLKLSCLFFFIIIIIIRGIYLCMFIFISSAAAAGAGAAVALQANNQKKVNFQENGAISRLCFWWIFDDILTAQFSSRWIFQCSTFSYYIHIFNVVAVTHIFAKVTITSIYFSLSLYPISLVYYFVLVLVLPPPFRFCFLLSI